MLTSSTTNSAKMKFVHYLYYFNCWQVCWLMRKTQRRKRRKWVSTLPTALYLRTWIILKGFWIEVLSSHIAMINQDNVHQCPIKAPLRGIIVFKIGELYDTEKCYKMRHLYSNWGVEEVLIFLSNLFHGSVCVFPFPLLLFSWSSRTVHSGSLCTVSFTQYISNCCKVLQQRRWQRQLLFVWAGGGEAEEETVGPCVTRRRRGCGGDSGVLCEQEERGWRWWRNERIRSSKCDTWCQRPDRHISSWTV